MEKNSIYSGMVNMRKLTMFNPAAFAGAVSGDDKDGKHAGAVKSERRRRNDRRSSDRRSSES